ncbi:hypothetical protein FXO37_07930 [Capsicum annuum]|nr:hypothetical protein FXO37_07930 [Capsicum annuum]
MVKLLYQIINLLHQNCNLMVPLVHQIVDLLHHLINLLHQMVKMLHHMEQLVKRELREAVERGMRDRFFGMTLITIPCLEPGVYRKQPCYFPGSCDWLKNVIGMRKAKDGRSKKLKGTSAIKKSNGCKDNPLQKDPSKTTNGVLIKNHRELGMPIEDRAAIKIQTAFRAYVATTTRHYRGGLLENDEWEFDGLRDAEPSHCPTGWDVELLRNVPLLRNSIGI